MKLHSQHTLNRQNIFVIWILLSIFIPINTACSQTSSPNSNERCVYVEDGFGPDGQLEVKAEMVVSGLEVPWAIAFLPNNKLLVTERPGRVRLVENYNSNAQLVDKPVATLDIASSSEGGLLGITLHPDFEDNRLFYLYVTVNKGNDAINQVVQWRLAEDGTSAEQVRVIYDAIAASRNHNGGRIAFGPDDMLYIGTGDASDPGTSQDTESPNGKILRLTPDGNVPDDNPRAGNPLFLMGIRNTQGWAWPDQNDANTLWVTDHGPSGERMRFGHDEVSIVSANDNLGWPTIYKCESREGMITPSLVWQNAVPPGGAAIYTGDAIPEWKGNLFIGTLGSRHIHRVVIESGSVTSHEVYFRNEYGRLREVIMGPDGHLYFTTSNCDGRGSCPDSGDAILRVTK